MALKLGKCRLCLKLGDFYSIFTADNGMQLAEMVMDCARIKVYDGDGLPDKVCSECIQKLSSAYIFKLQCERSDQELRRNYVRPPGFSISPRPPTRQSSDSAFSIHTDISKPSTSTSGKFTTAPRSRKRSIESIDNRSQEYRSATLTHSSHKKTGTQYGNVSSDNEDNFIDDTDSDYEPMTSNDYKRKICSKGFKSLKNVANHARIHNADGQESMRGDELVAIPSRSTEDVEDKLACDNCGKTFKLKIMLNRHKEVCGMEPRPQKKKELLASLEPIDCVITKDKRFDCQMCKTKFKTIENLENHMRVVHAAVLKRNTPSENNGVVSVPCIYCKETFDDFYLHCAHFSACSKRDDSLPYKCLICSEVLGHSESYIAHLKNIHFELNCKAEEELDYPECRMCNNKLATQEKLISHLTAHIPSYEEGEKGKDDDEDDRESTRGDTASVNSVYSGKYVSSGSLKSTLCNKKFKYKKALMNHLERFHNSPGVAEVRHELPDKPSTSLLSETYRPSESESSRDEGDDNTCDICEKQFSYRRVLLHHKRTKHNMSSGTKQAKINLKDCSVKCLICEVEMKVSAFNEHNQEHISMNLKPRYVYNCAECGEKFKNCSALARHIKYLHRLKQQMPNIQGEIADFYEVVVTKAEPLDSNPWSQSRNEFPEVPLTESKAPVNLSGLTCHICSKKMPTLISLKRHVIWHTSIGKNLQKTTVCFICKETFRYQYHYKIHMRVHYQDTSLDPKFLTCTICDRRSKNLRSATAHMNFHKQTRFKNVARHECKICHVMFINKIKLKLHTRTHFEDDNGPFKCPICGKGFIDENYFKRHHKAHNLYHISHKKPIENLRKDKVKCPICTRYYPNLVKLTGHLRKMHPESKMIKNPRPYFSCKLCAKIFLNQRRLQNHEEAHLRKPEFFKCKFCRKNTISLKHHRVHIKSHLNQKYIDNPLKCYKCEQTFIKGYDLHHHLRDDHSINETWIAERKEVTLDGPLIELQCSICYKVLASKGNYERHIDYHNSLRCNYCFDYFSGLRFLEGHLAFSCNKKKLIGDTEVYPRKIKCHWCYKAFHLQVKLDCHLRTQHDVRVCREASENKQEIVCDYCFKVFENEYALNNHKIYHRTVGFFGCIYCNRKFNTLTLYRKHKNHHLYTLNVDNPTKCEHCDETFVAFREMIYHMRDDHNDDKDWVVMPKESVEETCTICNKTFFNLHRHLQYHEENKCKKCNEYFYSRLDYDNHLCAVDSEDEPTETSNEPAKYQECKFCFKPITKKDSKLKHDKIHRGSGSISCRFCPLKFKTMDTFNIHAFSHQNRNYFKKPIKCPKCGEKFVEYGPLTRHMKSVHKSTKTGHYRTTVMPERCHVCGDDFPNLHNHYRAHLLNQCQLCRKYFTSSRLFSKHECDKEDSDPSKVFTCDENLMTLIKTYVAKDENDDEKFYGHTDEDEDGVPYPEPQDEAGQHERIVHSFAQSPNISDVLSLFQKQVVDSQNRSQVDDASQKGDELSQNGDEQSQSGDGDVKKAEGAGGVVNLADDDSVDFHDSAEPVVIVIDDD